MSSISKEINGSWVKEMKVAFKHFDPRFLYVIANSKPVAGNSGYESLKHMLRKELEHNRCLHDADSTQILHSAVVEVIEAASDLIEHCQGKSLGVSLPMMHREIEIMFTSSLLFSLIAEPKDDTSGEETESLVSQLEKIHLRENKRAVVRQPELTYDVLLPRLSDYIPPRGKPSINFLLKILQDPKPGSRDVLLRHIIEFCSYGTRFCPGTKQIVEDMERKPLLQEIMEGSYGEINDAIQIGQNFETVVPFQLSIVIISTSYDRGRDSPQSWKELKNICMLLIMLSSVKNVVFVPTTFTEGNTVFVTPSARKSCDLRARDMNIILKSKHELFTLNHGMLENILNGIKKKSTVYV